MDKIKVEPHVPSVYPLLPLNILQLDASRFQAVEAADWWTLYYIDAGCAEIGSGQGSHCLTQFQGILLRPGQEHNLLTFRDSSATVIQLDLQIENSVASPLCEQLLLFDIKCRKLLREIVGEAEMFCREVGKFTDREDMPAEVRNAGRYAQLLCEQLFIQLERCRSIQIKQTEPLRDAAESSTPWEPPLRRSRRHTGDGKAKTAKTVVAQTEMSNVQLFNQLVKYLEERVYESISLDELVSEFHFSKTHLSHTFKVHSGQTILTYYNNLKIEEAKRLILDTDMNFSQISNQLNFSSLHYFSRLFKKHTSMSPSEYQNSVID